MKTEMGNVVSIIVVTVFLVIVFRKRLAPFLKSVKGKQAAALPDQSGQESGSPECIRYDVLTFDANKYWEDFTRFGNDVTSQLKEKLDYVCYNGSVQKVEVIIFGRFLLFMISWKARSGERN